MYVVKLTSKEPGREPELHCFSAEDSAKFYYENIYREEDACKYEKIELMSLGIDRPGVWESAEEITLPRGAKCAGEEIQNKEDRSSMPENYRKNNKPGSGVGTGRLRSVASGGVSTQKRTNAVEIILLDPESQTSGYSYLKADGTLAVKGFRDLLNQNVRFSVLEGAVILAHDDEEIPPEECIRFDEKTFSSKAVVKFLSENHAIGTLFAKIFGAYSACPDIRILNYLSLQK